MRKLVAGQKYVLVFTEKHGERYFAITSEDALRKAALKVLTSRYNQKWYYPPEDKEPEKPSYTLEEIDLLKGEAQAAAKKEFFNHKTQARVWQRETDQWLEIQKAINTKDGELAYAVLQVRSDYEYERMELHYAEDLEQEEST